MHGQQEKAATAPSRGRRRPVTPPPSAGIAAALAALPAAPGLYRMHGIDGAVLYVGRSSNLRARVRSYWTDLRGRRHLAALLMRTQWIDAIVCASEHEAAFLERNMLQRRRPPFNRSRGLERPMFIRVSTGDRAGVTAVARPDASTDNESGDGVSHHGPYLGWDVTRSAAEALARLHPVHLAGDRMAPTSIDLRRARNISAGDGPALAASVRAVLAGESAAIDAVDRRLIALRDTSAAALQFEVARQIENQRAALAWVLAPQRAAWREPLDVDIWVADEAPIGAAPAVATNSRSLARFVIRSGCLLNRIVVGADAAGPEAAAAQISGAYARRRLPQLLILAGALRDSEPQLPARLRNVLGSLSQPDEVAWNECGQANLRLAAKLNAAHGAPPTGQVPPGGRQ